MSARSFRPLWAVEELGVPYELKVMPFPPRVAARHFLDVNPLGTVPALFDGATGMTESSAICQYLASKYSPGDLDVGIDEADFGAYLDFLHFGEATLTVPQTLLLRYGQFESTDRSLPQVVVDYTKWFLARLRTIEGVVSAQQFLCAARFTAADISVGYALFLAQHLGLAERFPPAVAAYWGRLQEREGFQRAKVAQDLAAVAQHVPTTPVPDLVHFQSVQIPASPESLGETSKERAVTPW